MYIWRQNNFVFHREKPKHFVFDGSEKRGVLLVFSIALVWIVSMVVCSCIEDSSSSFVKFKPLVERVATSTNREAGPEVRVINDNRWFIRTLCSLIRSCNRPRFVLDSFALSIVDDIRWLFSVPVCSFTDSSIGYSCFAFFLFQKFLGIRACMLRLLGNGFMCVCVCCRV